MAQKLSIIEWTLLQWMATPVSSRYPHVYNSFVVSKTCHLDKRVSTKVYFGMCNFVAEAEKAAISFVERGWVTPDEFGNNRLNDAGFQAAKEIPKPEWKPPAQSATLTKRDRSVLAELEYACLNHGWATPLDCGGRNRSHHSATLVKLVRCGYAECAKNGKILTSDTIIPEPSLRKRAKGSRLFRITAAGKAILK